MDRKAETGHAGQYSRDEKDCGQRIKTLPSEHPPHHNQTRENPNHADDNVNKSERCGAQSPDQWSAPRWRGAVTSHDGSASINAGGRHSSGAAPTAGGPTFGGLPGPTTLTPS